MWSRMLYRISFLFTVGSAAVVMALSPSVTAKADDANSQSGVQEETTVEDPDAPTGVTTPEQRKTLRFADRRLLFMRVGLGGTVKGDPLLGDLDARTTFGVTFRWERPVHEYMATALVFGFYSWKAEGFYRDPAFDVALLFKGRYPFEMGRKARTFESELYLGLQIGGTIYIESAGLDLIGPGWNIGIAPGFQFFINDRIGLLAEVGWMRTQVFFYAVDKFSQRLNQATMRIGVVFPVI